LDWHPLAFLVQLKSAKLLFRKQKNDLELPRPGLTWYVFKKQPMLSWIHSSLDLSCHLPWHVLVRLPVVKLFCCVWSNRLVMATSEGLASGRDRRSNAGAHMSRLLDAEDDDDFYKTTYGGFTEVCDAVLYKIISYLTECFVLGAICSLWCNTLDANEHSLLNDKLLQKMISWYFSLLKCKTVLSCSWIKLLALIVEDECCSIWEYTGS